MGKGESSRCPIGYRVKKVDFKRREEKGGTEPAITKVATSLLHYLGRGMRKGIEYSMCRLFHYGKEKGFL